MTDIALLKMLDALRREIRLLRLVMMAEEHTVKTAPYNVTQTTEDFQVDDLAREALEDGK